MTPPTPDENATEIPEFQWIVELPFVGQRVDQFLVEQFSQLSRSQIQKQINADLVCVDQEPVRPSFKLKLGHIVTARFSPEPDDDLVGEDIPLKVLYEDEEIVAIDKPPGMVVHPAKGHWRGTLTAALTFHFQQLSQSGGRHRPGIVHRLDRDTSGIILIAKNDYAHQQLTRQFEARTVQKEYWAAVSPAPDRDRDLIDLPIGAHPYQREKMAIRHDHPTSRPAVTFFEVQERFAGMAILNVQPKTGRTHQIRVHLAHRGTPVLCDRLYSGRAQLFRHEATRADDDLILGRQALHAMSLEFQLPGSGQRLRLTAPLPEDLNRLVAWMRENRRK